MMKVVGVLAFAVMMLVAGVTEVPAVAFNSAGGQGSCTGTATFPLPTTCVGGWVAVAPDPGQCLRSRGTDVHPRWWSGLQHSAGRSRS